MRVFIWILTGLGCGSSNTSPKTPIVSQVSVLPSVPNAPPQNKPIDTPKSQSVAKTDISKQAVASPENPLLARLGQACGDAGMYKQLCAAGTIIS